MRKADARHTCEQLSVLAEVFPVPCTQRKEDAADVHVNLLAVEAELRTKANASTVASNTQLGPVGGAQMGQA